MNFMIVFPVLLLIFVVVVYGYKNPEVIINDGKVQGVYDTSYNGRTYMAFLGIPYAEPPVDELRFKDPQPISPWTGTIIANQTTTCLQLQPTSDRIGVEDCLHINVYVPGSKIVSTANLDVIVLFNGGANMLSNDNTGPKFLMDREVILVNFNYRIGILGFLSTGDKYMPGNYGMKDQVLALKWIRKNIECFGGNKKSVTIHGHSSGAASVHYHYLSPLSRGLFDRGLSISGCALMPSGMASCPLQKAKILADAFNCSTKSTKKLVSCLRNQCPLALTDATAKLRSWLFNPMTPVSIVVDDSSPNPFLPKHPYQILLDKEVYDVPWISTHVTSEGVYHAAEIWADKKYIKELDKNWCSHAPDVLSYRDIVDESEMDKVSYKIKDFYLPKGLNKKSFPDFIRLIGDRMFLSSIGLCQELHARAVKSPVITAFYDYISEKKNPLHDLYSNISCHLLGPGHGDDIRLIYSTPGVTEKLSKCDEDMKDLLLDMLTEFAKTGRPNIWNWPPIQKKKCTRNSHLYIGRSQELRLKETVDLGQSQFWQELLFKENTLNLCKNL